jgi:hypothetical protein
MKAERRHELQDNELANWIGQYVESVKPYSKTILAIVLLAVAAAIAGGFVIRDQSVRAQLGWNDFYQAFGQRNSEALEDVATQHAGTEAAIWATQAEADLQLAEGVRALFMSREQAGELLESAKQRYKTVADSPLANRLLKERAWFGLGRAHESLSELDDAIGYYERLAKSSPDSALGKESQRRMEMLQDPEVEKWYNWFAHEKPRPPAIPGMPGLPGNPDLPGDLLNLPDRPDISLPTPIGTETPIGPQPAPPATTEENDSAPPAPTSEKSDAAPAATAPAEGEPAEGPPAKEDAEAKPANESPAPAPEKPQAADAPAATEGASGEAAPAESSPPPEPAPEPASEPAADSQ